MSDTETTSHNSTNMRRKRRSPRKRRSSFPSLRIYCRDDYSSCGALAVVPPTSTSKFKLPIGWRVKEVLRANGSHSDKYYYEPGTGRQFRSLISVQRHLRGEEYTPLRKQILPNRSSIRRRMIITNGKMLKLGEEDLDENPLAIVASSGTPRTSVYNLPDGWVVEEVPRSLGNRTDKYYYEPGTGRKFRSPIAVQRYLAESGQERPLSETFQVLKEKSSLSKMCKADYHAKNSVSFVSPPKRINWTISSPKGDVWDAFIGETLIPDSVKNQWAKRFTLLMNEE